VLCGGDNAPDVSLVFAGMHAGMTEETYQSGESSQTKRSCPHTKSVPNLLRAHIQVIAILEKKYLNPRTRFHIDVPPLHSKHVCAERKHANNQAGRGAPPDGGRADQVILALHVYPGAHAQAEPHEWPVCRRGREDVFLVWVRYERVVRGHHCNV
jgi:hypothetical protein